MRELEQEIASLDYSVRRYFVDEFHFRHISSLARGSTVLDLGGNKIRKRGGFDIGRYGLKVIYANLSTEKQPDAQADGGRVPFADECFDVVICAEVLEHVWEPESVLKNIFRVLKPSGRVFITTPFMYRVHGDPQDFYRYTDYYWHCALQEIGFRSIVVERQGLFFSVMADILKQYIAEIGLGRPFGRIARGLAPRVQRWALKRERDRHVQSSPFFRSFTTGYGITAVR